MCISVSELGWDCCYLYSFQMRTLLLCVVVVVRVVVIYIIVNRVYCYSIQRDGVLFGTQIFITIMGNSKIKRKKRS